MGNLNLQGFRISRELSHLSPLLKNRIKLTTKYSEKHPQDSSWWYSERASIGILAAAAWQISGWTSLEEYSTNKVVSKNKTSGEDARAKRGRCDLQIRGKRFLYAFEAKQGIVSLGSNSGQVEKAMGILKKAKSDVRQLGTFEGDHRFALAFVVPRISEQGLKDLSDDDRFEEVENRVAEFLVQLTPEFEKNKDRAFAWIFPAASRDLLSPNKKFFSPGVVLLIEKIHRGHRVQKVKTSN